MKKAFYLLLMSFILSSVQAQKTNLGLNLEKGKEYKQVSNSKITMIQNVMGQDMNMDMKLLSSLTYLVTDINDGVYEMEVKYDYLSTSMKLPHTTLEFNSENTDEQDMFSMVLSEMIDKPFQIKMTKTGRITEVKNVNKLLESAFGNISEIPESERAQLKDQLTNSYGEEAFKANMGMASAIYPDNPVMKGETWVLNTTIDSGMPLEIATTYTFVENHADHYLITGDATIASSDKDASVETNGIPMKYDMTGDMTSKIKVDKNSGWIIEATIIQDIKGDITMEGNDQMPEGMNISMSMKSDITYTDR